MRPRRPRKLPKRSSPPPLSARRELKSSVTKIPTKEERYKAGHRDECDICGAKLGTTTGAGRRKTKVEIWSFTTKAAKGKIYNRCKRHLGTKVK
jgi:ribosomal protein S14